MLTRTPSSTSRRSFNPCVIATLAVSALQSTRIKLVQPNTTPVHSEPYRSGPNTREFEKAEVEQMFAEDINEAVLIK